MQLYRLELGTLDMPDVKTEWVLRPHFNNQRSVGSGDWGVAVMICFYRSWLAKL